MQSFLSLTDGNFNFFLLKVKVEKVLKKESVNRSGRDVLFLQEYFKFTRFFKELKMKENQLS